HALIFLDPDLAVTLLQRPSIPFSRAVQVNRLLAYTHWRLGEVDKVLPLLTQVFEKGKDRKGKPDSTDVLAVAHYYIEVSELKQARDYIDQALTLSRNSALATLSDAVLLWLERKKDDALMKLKRAKKLDRELINVKTLAYEHWWKTKALTALKEMLEKL
ncbi:MAG: hypothetical protein HZB52_17150, partial [Chloroflexi bacterium]|nr:hypothetical protein [Chloroflexota bacterium]